MSERELAARAPTRIDLGGGWTDVPPYCERERGFVCNVAISRYATAIADVRQTAAPLPDGWRNDPPAGRDDPLMAAALRRAALTDVTLRVESDFPMGAGLGGSSAASAAILGVLRAWQGVDWELAEIAEEGRVIEVEDLAVAGGRQDHYAATHGGALALTFTDAVSVERIALSDAACAAFERRAFVVYTGASRISGDTITAVLDAYEARDRRVLTALSRMKALAEAMAAELRDGDIDDVGAMVAEHWVFQRQLHSAIPTPLIDQIVADAAKAGAIGAKALGASGGGCVLVIARDDSVDSVRRVLAPLGTIIDYTLDLTGLARV